MSDATTTMPAHRAASPDPGLARPARSYLSIAAALLAVFAVYTWLVVTWSPFIRLDNLLNQNFHVHDLWPVLHVLDRVGQRVLCLRPLIVIALFAAWWYRSLRPVVIAALGVFLINLMVLIVKIALSRGDPLSGQSFFGDGDLFPSGHTSNIMVVYGLCYYLITSSWTIRPRIRRAMLGLIAVFGLVQVTTSVLLRWHWFSDLVGGFLIGGVVLALTAAIDTALWSRSSSAPTAASTTDVAAEVVREPERELVGLSSRGTPGGSPEPAGGRPSRR